MGLSNVERYRALNSKKEKKDSSLSSNVQRYRELNLQRDIDTANKAISESFSGWQDADTMASNKTALEKAQKSLSSYYDLNQKNLTPEQKNAYSSALSNYNSALSSWDDTAKMYSNYINADAFNKAKKEYDLGQKYKGASYEDIQKALSEAADVDEISFLKKFTDYSSIEDFDKAIAEREAKRQETQKGRKGKVVDVQEDELKNAKDIYEKTHAFDDYKYLMDQADYAEQSKNDEALKRYETGTATDPIRMMQRGNVAFADSLSDEQKQMATYIYNTQGEDAYLDYMKKMTFVARQNEAAEMQRESSEFAKEHPVASSFMYPTFNTLMGGLSGVESLVSIANGETAPTVMQSLVASNSQSLGAISQGIKENYGKVPGFAYDVFTTGIPNRLGQMLFGSGYNVVMGLQSFSDTYASEIQNGTPAGTALLNALVTGGIETLTEQVGMEWAFGESKGAIETVLKQAFAEGSEEVVGSLANLIYDINVNGGEAEYYQNVNKYIEMGYDTKEARHQASMDFIKDVAHQFAVAAASTVPTGGVQQVSRVVNESNMGELIDREQFANIGSEELSKKYGEEWSQKASNREVYNAYDKYVTETQNKATEAEKGESVKALMSEYNLSEEEATKYIDALYDGKNAKVLKTHFGSAIKEEADTNTGWAANIDTTESSKYVDKLVDASRMFKSKEQIKAEKASKALKVGENNTVNGEKAEIISMKTNKDGTFTVKTSKGEVDAKDVTVTENKAKALSYSAEMTNEALKEAFVHYYQGEDIYDYDQYVRTAYEAGINSLDLSEFTEVLDGLGKAKAMAFYNLGAEKTLREEIATEEALDKVVKAYKSKNTIGKFESGVFTDGKFKKNDDVFRNLNRTQKKLYKVVEAFSKLSGVNVRVFVDRSAASKNGEFVSGSDGGWISINLAARPYGDSAYGINKYVVSTLSHELTHWMKSNNLEAYNILENAIVESLTEKGTLEKHIQREQDNYKKVEGKELSREIALEEVVARACEDMLDSTETMSEVLSHTDKTGLEKLKAAFEEWFNHIKEFFNELMSGFTSPNEITQSLSKEYEDLRKLWVKGINDAINGKRTGQTTEKKVASVKNSAKLSEREEKALDTLNVEIKDGYAYPKFNLKTYRESDYNKNIDIAAAALAKTMEISVDQAKKYIKDVGSIANIIARDRDRLDYLAIEGKSAWVSNPEYGGSLDYSFLCPKRLTYTGTMNAILKKQNDLIFSVDDFLWLRKALITAGYEAPCSFCFVESARARFGKYNQQFLDIAKEEKLAYIPTAEELTNPDKLEEMREQHPETYRRYEKFLNSLSQRKPKMLEERRAYNGDILKDFMGKENTIKDKNLHGGIRFNSFSDFEIVHMLDCMQAILDMSRVGLAGFGYTKQKAFAEIFGKTGLKINMSCVAKGIEADGMHVIFDDVEGMNHEEALKLRNGNVGIVCVVFNDAQLKAALCDERVDYVLPFHRSQWSKKDYEKMGLSLDTKDYTRPQTEKLGTKKAKEGNIPFLTYWNESQTGEETVQRYLDIINEQGKTPIFPMVLEKVDGKWTMPKGIKKNGKFINKTEEIKEKAAKNYWKVLTEFKLYDNDGTPIGQSAVKPEFNMKAARELLKKYDGSHKEFPVAQNVVNDFFEYKKTGETKNFEWKRSSNKMQTISSENTSLNQTPATFTNYEFKSTDRILDWGGGRYDTSKKALEATYPGIKVEVVDPFNRTESHNNRVLKEYSANKANVLTVNNVLNVINSTSAIEDVIKESKQYLSKDGIAYFAIYEGDGSGKGKETSAGYQNNQKASYYIPFVEKYYKNVEKKGSFILASDGQIRTTKMSASTKVKLAENTKEFKKQNLYMKDSLYSNKMDSDGKALTEDQAEYFKDSKVRDEQGRLKVMYHGTDKGGFTVFNPQKSDDKLSLFFSDSSEVSASYASTMEEQSPYDSKTKSGLYKVYLNIKNPYVLDGKGKHWFALVLPEKDRPTDEVLKMHNDFVEMLNKINNSVRMQDVLENMGQMQFLAEAVIYDEREIYGKKVSKKTEAALLDKAKSLDDFYETWNENEHIDKDLGPLKLKDYIEIARLPKHMTTREVAAWAKEKGYDGVYFKNIRDIGKNGNKFVNYENSNIAVAFNSNQIKSIYNEHPTENEDIRYSNKVDSQGSSLTEAQAKYFENSKVRDENGNLLVMYHGTYEEFNTFKPNKFVKEINGLSKIVGYFSEDEEYAKIYGDVGKYYLNIKNPLVMSGEAMTVKEWEKFFKKNGVKGAILDSSVTGKNHQKDPIKGGTFDGVTYYTFYEILDIGNYWYGDGNLTEKIAEAGYDGIQSGDDFEKAWMPFNANAVKGIDNLNPTSKDDFRKSEKMSYDELSDEAKNRIRELEEEVGRLSDENAALRAEKNMEKVKAEKKIMVDKITEQAKILSRWLLENDKKNPVPQAVRIPLGNFLTSIDFTKDSYEWRKSHGTLSKSDETLGTRMSKISQMLLELDQDKAVDKDAYDMSQLDWIPAFSAEFAKIKDTIAEVESKEGERFHLGKMSHDDLQNLLNLITALKTSIINMNKCLSAHNKMSVEGVGREVISYLDRIGQRDKDNAISQFLEISNTTPFYFFQRLGSGGEHTFRLLMDGMSKYAFEAKQIEDYAKKTFKGEDVKAWRDIVKTFEVDEYEIKTEKKEGEMPLKKKTRTIQMTVPQIMSLYCLSKRDQAMNHIQTGGIRVGTFETKEDGKKVKVRQVENVTLTKKDLTMILDSLDEKQIEVADKLQEFMNDTCQKWGNEVTMKRFGYKGMTEKNYFPINVDRNQLSSEARQKGSSLYQLLNMGFTKPINPKAKNPIEIFDIFETFTIHATEMAQYNSLALPVLDVIKIWNYRDQELLDEEENKAHWHSVKGSIEKTLGEKANGYIGRLLADLNGDVTGGRADKFGKKLIKNYKTAAVAANLQVAMLQPVSYIRAGYMVDNKYLTKGLAMKSDKEKCLKYCGIAVWKEMGFYNTAINTGLEHMIMQDDSKKDKAIEKTLYLAGKMDEWTWGKLWNACELETKDKYPTLKGEELYKRTGERLTEVIYGTQVVDSILTRSDLMRGADVYTNMITAFQAEPTLSLNILMDATVRFNQEKRASGAQAALRTHGDKIKRAAMVYLTSCAVESILRAIIGKIRNYDGDDDDETLIEDFFRRFIEELNPLRKIPLVKDVWNVLWDSIKVIRGQQKKLYTDTRMDEASIENIGNAMIQIYKMFDKQKVDYKTVNAIAKGIDASGLPVSSTMRVFKVAWNNTIGRIWKSLSIK